ncbi:Rrf2 family transcriptional regulator [Parasphingopyxis sp. GrpM-11]|uniref:Rrf2 family transcriptional regulator n=2 Tax=Parasphingopyxis marina TaxID=2761622 RepID=A0A842I2Y3_9SPHN|nr:Rrf2 family transcriptional regulator [Parasphingopyxis marina]
MAHLTVSVEYAIHSLLWLVDAETAPLSSRDLADFQGVSPSYLAKIFPKLEKAGIVKASEGVRGGYELARAPEDINFLQIVDAIEGRKPLFDCQEIRGRCAAFGELPPTWATRGVCSVHAVMLRAEKAMRETLAGASLRDLTQAVSRKAPPEFANDVKAWLGERVLRRAGKSSSSARLSSHGEDLS